MKRFLIIIDIQKGFIVNGINDHIVKRIDDLLKQNLFDCVITSIYKNYHGSPLVRLMGWNKLFDSTEQEVIGEALSKSDYFIEKGKYSAVSDELLNILTKENGGRLPDEVFVCGFDTECCVLMTATDLFEAGIRPILLSSYSGASSGYDAHQAGIKSLESLIGKNNIAQDFLETPEDLEKLIQRTSDITTRKKADNAEILVNLLISKGLHIAFAESCTGGLATAGIVDIPNASRVLNTSIVTYSNESKSCHLGVSEESLLQHGAVSEEVAKAMSIGAAKLGNAEIGVGISGIAGPGGGTTDKPVGTVCFGFYIKGKTYSSTQHFDSKSRKEIRERSVKYAYRNIIEYLEASA